MNFEGLKHAAEFRRCLVALDVQAIMRLHNHVHPEAPIRSPVEALHTLHLARTQAQSVPLKLRQYSHRWLAERGIGSHLPVHLHPKTGAERENSKRLFK